MGNSNDLCPFQPPFTKQQNLILCQVRQVMPENFSANTDDGKILGYAEQVLAHMNFTPPLTCFTTESVPPKVLPILILGIQLFTMYYMQMRATLEDFSWNDNGLTVQVDQVGKIGQAVVNLAQIFQLQIDNFKKTQIFEIGGAGLGTPRFQSQIGQFLKIALGSAFTWNSP